MRLAIPTLKPRRRAKKKSLRLSEKLPQPPEPDGILWLSPSTQKRIKNLLLSKYQPRSPPRTPRIYRPINLAPFEITTGTHKNIDSEIETDMKEGIVVLADPVKLANHLFPVDKLPIDIEELWGKLVEAGEILPSAVTHSRWLRWPTQWGNTRNGETERQLGTFLESLGEAISVVMKHSRARLRWTSRYSSAAPKGRSENAQLIMNRKPDVIAVKPHLFITAEGRILGWDGIDVVAELKTGKMSLKDFLESLGRDLGDRTFLIFEAQDGRRFIVYLSFLDVKIIVSVYDRSAIIHTRPLELHKEADAKVFLHFFLALTFGSDVSRGHDPTIKYYPETRIRTLTVAGPEYKILGVAWKNLMIQGRATICWYVDIGGEIRVVKSTWAVTCREPREEDFLRHAHAKGVKGIPTILEMGDVMVDGRIDSTNNNRGVYERKGATGSRTLMLDRTHRRIAFKECAVPLWYFASRRELFKVFIDCLKAHCSLVDDADILHRDMSVTNMMIKRGLVHPREGLLVDLGYAKFIKKKAKGPENSSKENKPLNLADSSDNNQSGAAGMAQEKKVVRVLGIRVDNAETGGHGRNEDSKSKKKSKSIPPPKVFTKDLTLETTSAKQKKNAKDNVQPEDVGRRAEPVGPSGRTRSRSKFTPQTGSDSKEDIDAIIAETSRRVREISLEIANGTSVSLGVSERGRTTGIRPVSGSRNIGSSSQMNRVSSITSNESSGKNAPATVRKGRTNTLTAPVPADEAAKPAARGRSKSVAAKKKDNPVAPASNELIAQGESNSVNRNRNVAPPITNEGTNVHESIPIARKRAGSRLPTAIEVPKETEAVGTQAPAKGRQRSYTIKAPGESSSALKKVNPSTFRPNSAKKTPSEAAVVRGTENQPLSSDADILPKEPTSGESNGSANTNSRTTDAAVASSSKEAITGKQPLNVPGPIKTVPGLPTNVKGKDREMFEDANAAMPLPGSDAKTNKEPIFLNTNIESNKPYRGRRTGTQPFISLRLLMDEHAEETPEDDIESVFWVFIYVTNIFTGPREFLAEKPYFIKDWLARTDDRTLGNAKKGWLCTEDDDFERSLQFVTPYFECAKPLIRKLANAVRFPSAGNLTHKYFIDAFEEALRALGEEEPVLDDELYAYPARPNQPALVDTTDIEERRKLRTLGPIAPENGDVIEGIVTADPDVPEDLNGEFETASDSVAGRQVFSAG